MPVVAAVVLSCLLLAGIVFLPPLPVAVLVITLASIFLLRRIVFSWTTMFFALAAVIMFIPVRRYALPIPLPFALEPYRAVLAIIVVAMIWSLARDAKFNWRPLAFGWPIVVFLSTIALSFLVNSVALTEQGLVLNAVGAMLSFLVLLLPFVVFRQLLVSEHRVYQLLTFITWAGAAVGFFALVEYATKVNIFLRLNGFLPLVLLRDSEGVLTGTGGMRAFGSAQHPIALAVAMCLILPIAVYLMGHASRPVNAINRVIVYGIAAMLIMAGIFAAVSRTAVVVLGVMTLVTLALRPRLGGTILMCAAPLIALAGLIVPHTVQTMLLSFFDLESLIASQYTSAGWGGAGRLADLGPAMTIVADNPFFGTGFGSRIAVGDNANSFILDNQWLGTLMDLGIVGTIALVILLLTPVVRLLLFAFRDAVEPRHAYLAFAVTVSVAGYIAAMFFYDAFAFYQTFFILGMWLAVGAWLLTEAPRRVPEESRPVASLEVAA